MPPRENEMVGAGYIIMRRLKSGRLKGVWVPFEHGTLLAAVLEAQRLAEKHPGEKYQVFVPSVTVSNDGIDAATAGSTSFTPDQTAAIGALGAAVVG